MDSSSSSSSISTNTSNNGSSQRLGRTMKGLLISHSLSFVLGVVAGKMIDADELKRYRDIAEVRMFVCIYVWLGYVVVFRKALRYTVYCGSVFAIIWFLVRGDWCFVWWHGVLCNYFDKKIALNRYQMIRHGGKRFCELDRL